MDTNQSSRSNNHRGPGITLLSPVAAILLLFAVGCESTGDCVATYEFEGTVVKPGYTRAECEAECEAVGRWLTCGFAGRNQSPLAPAERYDFDRPRA